MSYYQKYIKYKLKNSVGGGVMDHLKSLSSSTLEIAIKNPVIKKQIDDKRKLILSKAQQMKDYVSKSTAAKSLKGDLKKDYDDSIKILDRLIELLKIESPIELMKHESEIIGLLKQLKDIAGKLRGHININAIDISGFM